MPVITTREEKGGRMNECQLYDSVQNVRDWVLWLPYKISIQIKN